ncbi:hypothetical protein AB7W88_05070 [Providencia vermicola]|uniref:hypothetical protein n=1 Tax=Providencia vermicola TaxID=333965 RepID=UPI002EEA2A61
MATYPIKYTNCYTCGKRVKISECNVGLCEKHYEMYRKRIIEEIEDRIEFDKDLNEGMIFRYRFPENNVDKNKEFILIEFKDGCYSLAEKNSKHEAIHLGYREFDFNYELKVE